MSLLIGSDKSLTSRTRGQYLCDSKFSMSQKVLGFEWSFFTKVLIVNQYRNRFKRRGVAGRPRQFQVVLLLLLTREGIEVQIPDFDEKSFFN